MVDKSKLHPQGTVEKQYQEMEEDLLFYLDPTTGDLDKEKTIEVCCSLCGHVNSSQDSVVFSKFGFPYHQCVNCGLVYPNPRPKASYIEEQYVNGRFSKSFEEIYLPSAPYRMETIFKERVQEVVGSRLKKGKLLDIGCSSGHFLKVAENHGFEVYGIEPNPKMVSFATTQLELENIYQGTTDTVKLADNEFDAVTMWDVIEHVPEPSHLLKYALNKLKPGGWLFAYTENFDSFNYFVAKQYSEMFGADVHLRHYGPKTFRREFEQAGFSVDKVYTKGLDVQHIETIFKVYGEKVEMDNIDFMLENKELVQEVINTLGKGDNLRLIAQKPE